MEIQDKTQQKNEEVSLTEFIRVLLKRKNIVLNVTLIALIIAGIYSFISPKIYRISTLLEIGSINKSNDLRNSSSLIESPEQIVEKIKNDVYGIEIRKRVNISEKEFPIMKADSIKDTSLVMIEIKSDKTDFAKKILEQVDDLIMSDHQEEIKVKKELINQDIERITEKIKGSEEEKNNLEAKVDAIQKVSIIQQDPGTQFALFDSKEKLAKKKQEIENLYIEINSLKASLDNIKPTIVIRAPIVPDKPINPGIALNIILASIFGILVGFFVVFSKEWFEQNKKDIQ